MRCLITLAVAFTASTASTVLAEPWTFVSTPDFLNVDVGDLTTYSGPQFNAPSGNSYNASWQNAMDVFLDGIAAESPDFVTVAGDMVMARWHQDAWADGVFGPKFASKADRDANSTVAIEQQRVVNATNFYYDAWKQRFDSRDLTYYTAMGDHEIGDNPSWSDSFARQTLTTYRDQYAQHFVAPLTTNPPGTNPPSLAAGSTFYGKPVSGQHANTAYAIQHNNTLLVSVDVFKLSPSNAVTVTVADEQLAWLQETLDAANNDPTIDHIFVQGHTPALTPVPQRQSGGLSISGGAGSDFWQALRDAGVDAYLAGEVHDVAVRQDAAVQSLLQITHGGIFGFAAANDITYLKGTVDGDVITLEMKALGFSVSGDQFYQPGNPTTQLKQNITLDPNGFQTVGALTIDKSLGYTRFLNFTGVFAGLMPLNDPNAVTLGAYSFNHTGNSTGFTTDRSAAGVIDGVTFSEFAATGVNLWTSGVNNVGRFGAGANSAGGPNGWPGASGGFGPSNYDDARYVGFTVSADDDDVLLDLAGLSFLWSRSQKGPTDGILRVSTDGFVTWVEFELFSDRNDVINTDTLADVDLSALDPAGQFEFRFYFKDADTTGIGPLMRLDNVTLRGDLVPVPEPSAMLTLLAGVMLLRRHQS